MPGESGSFAAFSLKYFAYSALTIETPFQKKTAESAFARSCRSVCQFSLVRNASSSPRATDSSVPSAVSVTVIPFEIPNEQMPR